MSDTVKLDDIVSLAKRRGFIFPGSDVYGGLSGTWDYGPLGLALKRNIMNLWWKTFVEDRDDMYGVDAAILMNQKVWQASGHSDTFTDPLVECKECKARFRADHLEGDKCPNCGKTGTFGEPRQFNMMFSTYIGPTAYADWDEFAQFMQETAKKLKENQENFKLEEYNKIFLNHIDTTVKWVKEVGSNESAVYLRPETAQGIFTNYKNVVDTFYPDVPFGIAQMGKAFRNEISPRDFVFRSREFEQMEIEYFVRPDNWEKEFEKWRSDIKAFLKELGLAEKSIHEDEVPDEDRAHYSKRTVDFEFDFPHKRDELLGLAYRTDFDLMNIQKATGRNMEYRPKDGSASFVPHVIEPSFGVERAIMAVLTSAYTEDEVNGEKRIYLKLPAHLAPVKVAISPLLKNKPELVKKAREVYAMLKKATTAMPELRSLQGGVVWDDNGNIGKRYRRQDEIGTPYCVVIDFDTLEDNTVTVRDRDTTEQKRVKIDELVSKL